MSATAGRRGAIADARSAAHAHGGGDRRDFLPDLVAASDRAGAGSIVLEHGYGEGMGLAADDYRAVSPKVRFADYEEVLASDVVAVIRARASPPCALDPEDTLLVTMLHYATRPERTRLIADAGLRAISLDAVTDDLGRRLVEYLEAVAWNGVRLAFVEVARMHRSSPTSRRPLHVTCLGAGRWADTRCEPRPATATPACVRSSRRRTCPG